jgi:hypothetical protein
MDTNITKTFSLNYLLSHSAPNIATSPGGLGLTSHLLKYRDRWGDTCGQAYQYPISRGSISRYDTPFPTPPQYPLNVYTLESASKYEHLYASRYNPSAIDHGKVNRSTSVSNV